MEMPQHRVPDEDRASLRVAVSYSGQEATVFPPQPRAELATLQHCAKIRGRRHDGAVSIPFDKWGCSRMASCHSAWRCYSRRMGRAVKLLRRVSLRASLREIWRLWQHFRLTSKLLTRMVQLLEADVDDSCLALPQPVCNVFFAFVPSQSPRVVALMSGQFSPFETRGAAALGL